MSNRVCLIGHRRINTIEVAPLLESAIKEELDNGCRFFTMGTHGDFDKLALSICRKLKQQYPDMIIEVVLTSLNKLNQKIDGEIYHQYEDVQTIMYDIENFHFKQQITESNKQMINDSDILICYVSTNYTNSGAKTVYNYAKRKGLEIINIYNDNNNSTNSITK